jgi:formylglycine-generating enzyme required for sulfatase activity/serine/threonine protein kinase
MDVQVWHPEQLLKGGRFKILHLLGRGTTTITYLAQDRQRQQRVVIQTLNSDRQSAADFLNRQERFLGEGFTLKSLVHPHLVTVLEPVQFGELWGLVMDYVEGQSLADVSLTHGPLAEAIALTYIEQIAQALTVVHRGDFYHRDLNPRNIILRPPDSPRATLINFGLGHHPQAAADPSVYKPIEHFQLQGQLGAYTDIYALGATLYTLLAGHPPGGTGPQSWAYHALARQSYQALGVAEIVAGALWEPLHRLGIREAVIAGLQAALELQGDRRPQSVAEFLELLGLGAQQCPPTSGCLSRGYASGIPTASGLLEREHTGDLGHYQEAASPSGFLGATACPHPLGSKVQHYAFSFKVITLEWQVVSDWQEVAAWQTVLEKRPQLLGMGPKAVAKQEKVTVRKPIERSELQVVKTTKKAKCLIEDLDHGLTLKMIAIPQGGFVMGRSPEEQEVLLRQAKRNDYHNWAARELPQHLVRVPAFYLGKYPVTQGQYEAIMGCNPSRFKGDRLPVEQVSWQDAQDFCRRLSQRTGRHYRLPSEAEWEYACRAGSQTPFHFGPALTTQVANFDGRDAFDRAPQGEFLKRTTLVGAYRGGNDFGLYDLHGNLWEWCEDSWHEHYRGAPSDGQAWVSSGNDYRVLRGGSWISNAHCCRSAYRNFYAAQYQSNFVGFRVACSAPQVS